MMKQTLVAAMFVVTLSQAFIRTEGLEFMEDGTPVPTPGGFQAIINVPSFGNLLNYAGLFVPYYALRGKTIDLGINMDRDNLQFELNNATLTNVAIPAANLSFVNDTSSNNVMLSIPGCTINADVDGMVKGGISILQIEADFKNITLTNVTINLEMGTSSDNQVNWQLSVDPYINIGDIDV